MSQGSREKLSIPISLLLRAFIVASYSCTTMRLICVVAWSIKRGKMFASAVRKQTTLARSQQYIVLFLLLGQQRPGRKGPSYFFRRRSERAKKGTKNYSTIHHQERRRKCCRNKCVVPASASSRGAQQVAEKTGMNAGERPKNQII